MMKKFTIALVTGDHMMADQVSTVLDELGYDRLPIASSYSDAMESILKDKPDFLIMSSELAGQKSGRDLASWLNQKHPLPYFFLSPNSTVDGLDLIQRNSHVGRIAYPLIKQQLQTAILTAVRLFHSTTVQNTGTRHVVKQHGDFCFVKEGGTFYRLEYGHIYYVESRENYLKIFTEGKNTLVVRATMKEFHEILAAENFIRISRSHIVQLRHIEKINATHVCVNGIMLPIGKTYKEVIYKTLGLRESGISVSGA